MKKRIAIASGLLSALFVFALVGCDSKQEGNKLGGDANWCCKNDWMTVGTTVPTKELVLPTEDKEHGNVSVHDPSVFYDEVTGDYYAFGTHFAVAKSADLIRWSQVAGDNAPAKLYGSGSDWKQVLADSIAIVGSKSNSTWAPDVMYINNTYYMYYSYTKDFGSRESVIGRVSSSDIMGPYSNNEIIVHSKGSAGNDPNCIDPELFYDKEGRLWLVYGSFAGGIYIKELETTGARAGLPKDEGVQNYGKMLWKRGYSSGVEGPFIFYNAEQDYYYLMVSEGDLSTNYNMRIARSKNPDGPYVDIMEGDVSENAGVGNKIAGNFGFEGEALSFGALGHNSVIKREGKYFVVYHTRFGTGNDGVTGGHQLYVSQLYFNKDGWPVMSPFRYIGEDAGTVTADKLAGEFDVVVHNIKTEKTFVYSEKYTLTADGKVQKGGADVGTWSLTDGYYVTVTIGETAYEGVVCVGYREVTGGKGAGVYGITATSQTGVPLWAKGVVA